MYEILLIKKNKSEGKFLTPKYSNFLTPTILIIKCTRSFPNNREGGGLY